MAKKQRRPAKKLKADIGGLADALPHVEPVKPAADSRAIKMKSLRHRPGAMKRKHRLHASEMLRFKKNLAQLIAHKSTPDAIAADSTTSSSSTTNAASSASAMGSAKDTSEHSTPARTAANESYADRWAALRSFIDGTMEKDKAFGAKT